MVSLGIGEDDVTVNERMKSVKRGEEDDEVEKRERGRKADERHDMNQDVAKHQKEKTQRRTINMS